jgi:hypothetical protein
MVRSSSETGTRLFNVLALSLALALGLGCAEERTDPVPVVEPPPILDEKGRVPDLACPGAPGCESSEGELRAGVAAEPITPTVEPFEDLDGSGKWDEGEPFEDLDGDGVWDGVWIAGFSLGRAATGVHDDVWARALVLEKGDVRIGMVSLDLVGFFHDDVVAVRLAAKEAGLDLDHVVVSSTHTHEGPDTMGIWGPAIGETGYSAEYVQGVVIAGAVKALTEADASLRPAKLRVAVGEAPDLVNDTRLPEVVDQAFTLVQFQDPATNDPFATAAFWGNHPEALGSDNTLVSSDFPHYLRDELEVRYPGAPAVFFNGSLGGLSTTIGVLACPDDSGEETCPQGTWERAERIGRGAASAAADARDAASLAVTRRSFLLTTTNGSLAFAFWIGLLPRNLFWLDTGKQLTQEEVDVLAPTSLLEDTIALQSELNLVELGTVAIVTVPGELYPELWLQKPDGGTFIARPEGGDFPDAELELQLQSLLPAGVVPVIINNGNDSLGYILPKTQWDAVVPFAYGETDEPQYGEQNSLGPDTAGRLSTEFESMVGSSP